MGISPKRPKGFYLDRAVWYFGNKLEADMDKAEKSVKLQNMKYSARVGVFNRAMSVEPGFREVKRFRDPAIKIKES